MIDRSPVAEEIREKEAAKKSNAAKPAPQHHPALFYSDEHLAVVFKPAGLLTVPTPKRERKTLAMWLGNELKGKKERKDIRFVQRLDRDVSGVIVVSLSEQAYQPLRKQFELHQPQRRYLALVVGQVDPPQGTFSSLMATGKKLERFQVESKGFGERAITHYRVMQQEEEAALVEVWLETGRRHQIRVHFAEAGHPVLGDSRYKRHQATHRFWPENRIALHAATLEFVHPVSGESMKFTSSAPREFNEFFASLKKSKLKSKTGKPAVDKKKRGTVEPTRAPKSKAQNPPNKRARKKRN
jgi:23S rRNA pseudouridine1911/1915/1917 synthase